MAYYGFVSPGIKIITNDFEEIRGLISIVQYPKFKRFSTKERAIQFVANHTMEFKLKSLVKYGECFDKFYITVEYFIRGTSVYYNIFTNDIGVIDLAETEFDSFMIKEKRNNVIMLEMLDMNLKDKYLDSHVVAIRNILKIVGAFIDVELIIPNHSIFYLINSYTGDKRSYRNLIEFIRSRKGRVALTMKDWGGTEC